MPHRCVSKKIICSQMHTQALSYTNMVLISSLFVIACYTHYFTLLEKPFLIGCNPRAHKLIFIFLGN